MDRELKDRFIKTWGSMGSLWGINTSIARVHALLIATEEPLSLDEISKYLEISRGNTSMCLKELRNWGVIEKTNIPGQRKDFYVNLNDMWKMFFRISRERKRREFEPAMDIINKVKSSFDNEAEGLVANRFKQMEELMNILNILTSRFFQNDEEAKAALLLATQMPMGPE